MNVSTSKLVLPTKSAVLSTSIYLPVKSRTSFKNFKPNLEMKLDALSTNTPFLTVMICEFIAKSSNCYLNDITRFEGPKIEFLASQFAMSSIYQRTNSYFR